MTPPAIATTTIPLTAKNVVTTDVTTTVVMQSGEEQVVTDTSGN